MRLLPHDQKAWFKPASLLLVFMKKVNNNNRTQTFQLLEKVNKLITKKRTLAETWNSSRFVHIRLVGSSIKECTLCKAAVHLLKHLPTSILEAFTNRKVMQALRILQNVASLKKGDAGSPQQKTKNAKNRTKTGAKSYNDIVNQ